MAGKPTAPPWYRRIRLHENGCWEWLGAKTKKGYGLLYVRKTETRRAHHQVAHRFVYERLVGPIPDSLTLDHEHCNWSSCVNPWHMEPVTITVNVKRQNERNGGVAKPRKE